MSGNDGNDQFAEFANAGEVQVGESNLKAAEATEAAEAGKPAKPAARRGPPKAPEAKAPEAKAPEAKAPAGDDGDNSGGADGGNADDKGGDDEDLDLGRLPGDDGEGDGEGDDGDQGGEDDGDQESGRKRETAESRGKRLKRERQEYLNRARAAEAKLAALDVDAINARFAALENGGLPAKTAGGTNVDKVGPAPDPMDQAKYPLGHLDAQYVEDRINWATDKRLAERSDADLHRQQENKRTEAQQAEQQRVLQTVDTMAKKGAEIYDDFQSVVVDAGMKGDWKLQQPTFEAAADPEIEHGARILYNLAKNPAEAEKVAAMTPLQQLRYVDRKNAEIQERIQRRKIPGAGAPPQTRPRGGNSRVSIPMDTDNLDDFEKLVRQEAQRNGR